ncbi:hypothetical protein OOZ51_08535 [Arthrobacter sp. MI7-26]|uniref:hypothetical protein n=1 Tax=Arthrobacter sp. MI7-26 TaxID=2993653 RepID=UPI0022499344|nr:hypothetical protein [Arthrobacter sp. MI7-26]MCX2747866.1 hypothetical protein [Arthrobacter sp. MI7-26]
MLSLNEMNARIRSGHLLVRPAQEWDDLSAALTLARKSKDTDLVERMQDALLHSWQSVATKVLADTFDAAGIAVTSATHPWGIATFSASGNSCEPLLCEEDSGDGLSATTIQPQLLDFESVMNGYVRCLNKLQAV